MFISHLATMIGFPGPMELIIVFAIILFFFGAKKMPDMARSLGKAIGEFKRTQNDIKSGLEEDASISPAEESESKGNEQEEGEGKKL